ncbi:helix-turn-helix transcriptional regulator [Rahnella aquatilis]|nr:helix-turn-helix transcriptional regulator [Rahnella aquatilis]
MTINSMLCGDDEACVSPRTSPVCGTLCLIPACRYVQAGLEALGQQHGHRVDILAHRGDMLRLFPLNYRLVACDLSGGLAASLDRLALLGALLRLRSATPPAVVLITRLTPAWLYGTLMQAAGHMTDLPDLWVVDDRAPPGDLVPLTAGTVPAGCQRLLPHAGSPHAPGLTPRELSVMVAMLGGETVRAQAARLGITVSTVHSHRHAGQRKLGMLRKRSQYEVPA